MTDYRSVRSNDDIYKAKADARRQRAAEPFERKLLALVRMQMLNYAVAKSGGRTARPPWHAEDKLRMMKYADTAS